MRCRSRCEFDVCPAPLADDVATTAYYVAAEAITNAAKHANATAIRVRVTQGLGGVEVRVQDDGCGGAAPRNGSGLAGLADRVAAVGGSLQMDSPAGAGTTIEAGASMRIVIGEDSALFREGLASLLIDAGHDVVGRAADADTLVSVVAATSPDLAIIDVRMPPDLTDDGARAARRIRADQPDVAIVLLSQHVETRHSVELVSSGGFGYLLKDRVLDVDEFLDTLARVASGGSALDPEVVSRLIGRRSAPSALTPREREVLALMAEGCTNVGIARRLWLNERTVETHVGSIMAKLGLVNNVEEHRRVLAVLTYLGQRLPI